jgi:hypothetical protein
MVVTISKCQPVCSKTGREFKSGEDIRSVLKKSGLETSRQDYSIQSWEALAEDLRQDPEVISTWSHTFNPPVKEDPVIAEQGRKRIRSIFDDLVSQGESGDPDLLYFIALYLARRRVLTWEARVDDAGDGKPGHLFVVRGSGESLLISEPDLSEENVERISRQLENILTPSEAKEVKEGAQSGEEPSEPA